MIFLCGGEGAAGLETGGVFFLFVSYGGPCGRGGHPGLSDAAWRRAQGSMACRADAFQRRCSRAEPRARPAVSSI